MESVGVRRIPIGVNATVRYKGCDVDKWLEFGHQIARVRLVSQDRAACLLSNGKTAWAQLNELERVSPQELQATAPQPSTTQRTLREIPPAQPSTPQPHGRTTQARPIDPTHLDTVREMPITWKGFRP